MPANVERHAYRVALRTYAGATARQVAEGRAWYPEAAQVAERIGEISGRRGVEARRWGAAMLAVNSPTRLWAGNVTCAERTAADGVPRVFARDRAKVAAILAAEPGADYRQWLGDGPKVPAFFELIASAGEAPTVALDLWHGRLLGFTHAMQLARANAPVLAGYARAAGEVGEGLGFFGAVLWVAVREGGSLAA